MKEKIRGQALLAISAMAEKASEIGAKTKTGETPNSCLDCVWSYWQDQALLCSASTFGADRVDPFQTKCRFGKEEVSLKGWPEDHPLIGYIRVLEKGIEELCRTIRGLYAALESVNEHLDEFGPSEKFLKELPQGKAEAVKFMRSIFKETPLKTLFSWYEKSQEIKKGGK